MATRRLVSVDDAHKFPTPLEARIFTPITNAEAKAQSVLDRADAGDFNGLDGSNVLPTDTAIAQAIETDSASRGALQDVVDEWVGVNARNHGAKGDGAADDTTSLQGLFSAVSTFGIRKVMIPAGTYRTTVPLDIATEGVEVVFDGGAEIRLESTGFNDRPITVSGNRNRIIGGKFTSTLRKKFLLAITGSDNTIVGPTVTHATKSTMPLVPGTSIYYNQGGIEVRGARNIVERAEASNTEGAGIYLYGDGNKAVRCHSHDNCTGVIVETGTTNAAVLDSIIVNNNVNFAEGYDGILATADGLIVRGNTIAGNGEHGTYIHGKNFTVSGNTVRGNYFNGIKVGNVEGGIVAGNTLENNNTSGTAGESQIYLQKGFKRVTIAGNTETARLSGNFIRVWSDQASDENVTIIGNVGLGNIDVHAASIVNIADNSTVGDIILGYVDASYPLITRSILSGNIANRLVYGQCMRPSIRGNTANILVGIGTCAAIVKGNQITGQNIPIPLRSIKEFSGNTVTFTMTANTDTLFQQDTIKRNGIRFLNNDFTSSGGRFLFFTSEGISSDNLTIMGNSFAGVLQPLYFWGSGHQIIGNRADQQMGFLGCNNSIITGNIKEPSMRSGLSGNVFANNIP